MNDNDKKSEPGEAAPPKRRRASLPLIIVAALFIIVPFLTWYGTWFGRGLSDQDIASYLGLAIETVSRTLSKMQEDGVIAVNGRQVKILDSSRWDQLVHHHEPARVGRG